MDPVSRTYRVIALGMAFLMFATSAGFAIDMHYCQGQLKSMSIFGNAKSCQEKTEAVVVDCPVHGKMMVSASNGCATGDKSCCDDETILVQSDQDQILPGYDVNMSKQFQQFVVAFASIFLITDPVQMITPDFLHYKPPLLLRDVCVLVQSFLL